MLPFECRQGGYKGPLLAERIELHLDSVTSYEDLAGEVNSELHHIGQGDKKVKFLQFFRTGDEHGPTLGFMNFPQTETPFPGPIKGFLDQQRVVKGLAIV
ncbi:hypothetical protein COCSUDRAFT_34425 [Coccomyxa subellipsoidea C-169]|uniref:Uncharacterized protein n=1 Tax=Coccomyxa subellipsoidea (strain C-169) TaxID=574566 RepID=I0YKJ7_COCSC|nr:hypothetical protein COCSUDRAFT_34425 [Coccomyxa subellipsoidea C-169]EIE18916.1 hypothetical protein COCSUDRAFT_34425 [Coccomyxa subellipsoidea C-169]|eukprot:XP_005643460.1 hypothetical protein COCSUDRAFT_34425 [Coccomyxa subellipsoidea C-169]